MTNTIALILALLILGGIAVDVTFNDTDNLLFLSRKFFELLDWVAFWR